jgi:hypothetical protein
MESDGTIIMKDGLENMWKEVVVACYQNEFSQTVTCHTKYMYIILDAKHIGLPN